MTVVRIPPTLRTRSAARGRSRPTAATVGEVLDDLAGRYPALGAHLFANGEIAPFVNVYLGGEDVRTLDGLETPVDRRVDGDPPARDGRRHGHRRPLHPGRRTLRSST